MRCLGHHLFFWARKRREREKRGLGLEKLWLEWPRLWFVWSLGSVTFRPRDLIRTRNASVRIRVRVHICPASGFDQVLGFGFREHLSEATFSDLFYNLAKGIDLGFWRDDWSSWFLGIKFVLGTDKVHTEGGNIYFPGLPDSFRF